MARIDIPHKFNPRPYQQKVLAEFDSGKKRFLLKWSRRAGKDKVCWCLMIREACRVPGNYFYVFPTKEMAKRALWENIDKAGWRLRDHLPRDLYDENNQEMLIKIKHNGSTIRVIGLDTNPDAIRGVAAKGAVFSEFAFSDFSAYKNVMPSIREANGWVIINSTPNGKNAFTDMIIRAKENPKAWHYSIVQCYYPNGDGYVPLYSPAELKEIQEEDGLSDEDMEREYGCDEHTSKQGAIYGDQTEKLVAQGRYGRYPYDPNKGVYTFWDLGNSDDTVIWFVQYDGKKVNFFDYYAESRQDLKHYVDVLNEKGYDYITHYLPHDSKQTSMHTNKRTIDFLMDLSKEFKVKGDWLDLDKSKSVKEDIVLVRKRFHLYSFDDTNCKDGFEAIRAYHRKYDKKKQVFVDEPVHDWSSHAADALRMEAISQDQVIDLDDLPIVRSDFDVFDY